MGGECPLVSVIVCTYNAGDYLMPSLQSVLAQSHSNLDVLVVDDGSTDGSAAAAQARLTDPRIRWFRQANAGKPAAMNFAIPQARGEFYALQDADDISHPRRIERLVAAMRADPELAAVYSGHELILDGRSVAPITRFRSREACRNDIEQIRMPAHDPTGMYRLSMVRGLRYREDLLLGEGYDYIMRVGERWPMVVLGECLYSYRIHDASITRADPERRTRLVREVIRCACERRGIAFEDRPGGDRKPQRESHYAEQDNNLAAQFIDSVLDQRRSSSRVGAVRTALHCARLHPVDPHYYKALVYALSPWWLIKRIRRNGTI